MAEEPEAHIEVFLTKKGLNDLKKRELIAIMQLLRIINALRFQMGLLLHTKDEKDKLFRLRSELEIFSILAGSFKEAIKEFYNNLFKILGPLSDEKELKKVLMEYDTKTRYFKENEVLFIIDYIRNSFSFHIKSELFNNYIIEDDAKEDMLIGIAKSTRIIDWCFLKAYDALIFQVSGMAKSLIDKTKITDWLFENIMREANYFCDLLENFAGSIVKKYGEKRLKKKPNFKRS